ncbi:hypothetical protein BPNPMPFG_008284 (plasmid) [Mesorhizobium sp. AR07]|uniref:hypothetical protein n=1 Tax=Mesorhizobium sp. AR07 TaxID=2865838 RepID=UPI00215F0C7A|nr:hypothetical protein [Mesorhizobium sp. AR07]UVK49341.1 hypothetical protein BPNPMPFG_008284 [Mesorhizobium sp. AR07]
MSEAPKDGTPIVARDHKGRIAQIRWCLQHELEPHERPYWGRWDTDVEFHAVEWVPTEWTMTDILEEYG